MAIITASPTVFTTSVLIGDTTDIPINNSDPIMTKSGANNVSAALEIQSTKGAFLPPRMTTAQRDAPTFIPSNGMLIYNTTTNNMNTYQDGAWGESGNGSVNGPAVSVVSNLPRWANTTGSLLDDSGVTLRFLNGSNIGLGVNVLTDLSISGDNNLFIGKDCGQNVLDGDNNIGLGSNTLPQITESSDNIAIGKDAASLQPTYDQCVFLGSGADADVDGLLNAVAIGFHSRVARNSSIVLGGTNENAVNVGIGTPDPQTQLHLIGTFRQKGIVTAWTGTPVTKGQTGVQTTDDTPTTILTVPIPTTAATTVYLFLNVIAMRTTGLETGYAQNMFAGAFYNGTVTEPIGTYNPFAFTTTGSFAIQGQFVVSGDNLLAQVIGIDGKTINWVCEYSYYAATTSIL